MLITAQIVNSFVDQNQGGNPAGVVLDADQLSTEQKLLVAKKIGLSETAFVSKSQIADFKLDFFTPNRQIAHCGHATIATFSLLRQLDRIKQSKTSKETIEGRREIYIEQDMAFMEQLAPKYSKLESLGYSINDVVEALNLSSDDLLEEYLPIVANTGNSFLIVPLKDETAVLKARPNFKRIEKISEDLDLIGFYIFSSNTRIAGRDAGTRMFAPRYGIEEESATGMAGGPLACYLYDIMQVKKNSFLIEQGYLLTPASPSIITVNLAITDGKINSLLAGGHAKVVQTLQIDI